MKKFKNLDVDYQMLISSGKYELSCRTKNVIFRCVISLYFFIDHPVVASPTSFSYLILLTSTQSNFSPVHLSPIKTGQPPKFLNSSNNGSSLLFSMISDDIKNVFLYLLKMKLFLFRSFVLATFY